MFYNALKNYDVIKIVQSTCYFSRDLNFSSQHAHRHITTTHISILGMQALILTSISFALIWYAFTHRCFKNKINKINKTKTLKNKMEL